MIDSGTPGALPAPELVALKQGFVGALHKPSNPGPKAGIGVYVMHAELDYLDFAGCTELASRGYTVLCANNSVSKSGLVNDLDVEQMMLDVAKGVAYLRQRPEIRKVVLLGHSGGGAMMAAYQNIAENGAAAFEGPEKLIPLSAKLASLPKADGIMLLDANYGISGMTLLSLNPAIRAESNGYEIDPALDLFAPATGFTERGARYSPEFARVFHAGVAARMNRLVEHAQNRLRRINAGEGSFSDDEPMVIPDANYVGFNNKFFAQDPRFLSRTSQAWPLLHADGSLTTEVVHTVRRASGFRPMSNSYFHGALKTTVKRFLSTFAIRVGDDFCYGADDFRGMDWSSSHTAPIAATAGIHVPLLTMGMSGHWEFLAAEKIYLNAASSDKSIAFVEGASHTFTPCDEREKEPGQYGDTSRLTFDHVDEWLGSHGRFL
jgi:hypothetical protein